MIKKLFLIIALGVSCISGIAQDNTFSETGTRYPLSADGKKLVVSGFASFSGKTDADIFANAMLWAVENLCSELRDGITEVDVKKMRFTCNLVLGSMPNSGMENVYNCQAIFSVASGRLIYYLSNISVTAKSFISKNVTPFEKLNPEKKESHKEIMDDFVASESATLNNMFDFIASNRPSVRHWDEIGIRKPIVGMTMDECLIAFGKPKTDYESNGETQWMYSTSFILFFKDGKVCTVIK